MTGAFYKSDQHHDADHVDEKGNGYASDSCGDAEVLCDKAYYCGHDDGAEACACQDKAPGKAVLPDELTCEGNGCGIDAGHGETEAHYSDDDWKGGSGQYKHYEEEDDAYAHGGKQVLFFHLR